MAIKYTSGKSVAVSAALPATAGSGREIEVYIGPRYTTKIASFSHWVSLMGNTALNDAGGGSVTLDLADPQLADPLYNHMTLDNVLLGNNLWRVVKNGKAQFEFIPDSVVYNDATPGSPSTVTIAGKGPAGLLEKAVVLPPGFPKQTEKFWTFKNTPMMSAWLQLYAACRSRGTIPAFFPAFTPKKDSAGKPWADIASAKTMVVPFVPALGDSLLELLHKLTGQDTETASQLRCEWILWPKMKLDVRPKIGSDKSVKVMFSDGCDIIKRSRTIVSDDIRNYIVTRDVYGGTSLARDRSSCGRYGQQEQFFEHQLITNSSMRHTIANLLLEKQKDKKVSWTIGIRADVPGKEPFVNFNVGDWISFDIYDARTKTSSVEKLRVMSIAVSDTPTSQEAELVLETLLDAKTKEVARKITYTVNTINKLTKNTKITKLPPKKSVFSRVTDTYDFYDDKDGDYGFVDGVTGAYPATTDYDSLRADTGLVPDGGGGFTTAPISAGCHVYFQAEEPFDAQVGDIWIDYVPEVPDSTYSDLLDAWPDEDYLEEPADPAPAWGVSQEFMTGLMGANYEINPDDIGPVVDSEWAY